jgi:hypothetical protein
VVHLLRGYCSKHPKLWDEQLHYVQHAYNCAMHSSTQRNPFEVCLGYFPKSPMEFFLEKQEKRMRKMMSIKIKVHSEDPTGTSGSIRTIGENPSQVQGEA